MGEWDRDMGRDRVMGNVDAPPVKAKPGLSAWET